jgi:outer membrane protein OmpA-like peptidoglycan-associated protein
MIGMSKLLICVLVFAAGAATAGPDFRTPMPRGKSLAASQGTGDMMPSDDVVFANDSVVLTESANAQLDTVARWMRVNPRFALVVDGFADVIGPAAYNEDLAARRAAAVREQLVHRGVASDRIVISVYGERFADPKGSPLDRRVVMTASADSVDRIVKVALDTRGALLTTWTYRRAIFLETRRPTAVATR